MVGGLSAATEHGLRTWSRDTVTVLVDDEWSFATVPGIEFVRTRRPLPDYLGDRRGDLPVCQLEPAVLLFAGYEQSFGTAQGILAAVVQQQLTTPDLLLTWIERMRPLRRAQLFRRHVLDLSGGAQSLAEIDVRRMCRSFGLPLPTRQRARRDRDGRRRFTDCEWRLDDGRTVVLEVDGAFHIDVLSYGDDPASVAADLMTLGIRRSCA